MVLFMASVANIPMQSSHFYFSKVLCSQGVEIVKVVPAVVADEGMGGKVLFTHPPFLRGEVEGVELS